MLAFLATMGAYALSCSLSHETEQHNAWLCQSSEVLVAKVRVRTIERFNAAPHPTESVHLHKGFWRNIAVHNQAKTFHNKMFHDKFWSMWGEGAFCEVVYFLAYQEGTLPLIYGHLMTTTSLSLVVCILLLCCEFILKNS